MPKTWAKETPDAEGWYWIKYKDFRLVRIVPAFVMILTVKGNLLSKTKIIQSAMSGDIWSERFGPGVQKGIFRMGKLDKTIRFGPKIEEPE